MDSRTAPWSDMPADVLITILETLDDIRDLVRAGAVCQWWNASSSYVRGHHHLLACPRTLCLLYTTTDANADTNAATLYSLTDRRSYTVHLPGPHVHRRWLGASHGWLATTDDDATLHLVNPVTGQQISDLPPVTTVEPVRRVLDDDGNVVPGSYVVYPYDWTLRVEPLVNEPMTLTARELSEYLDVRVFLSSDPSDGGDDCVVALLHRPDGQISFARLGDTHWTWIRTPITGNEQYVDVTFRADVDGRTMMYGIRRDCAIHEFDLDGEPALESTVILPAQDRTGRHTNYLVDAPWLDGSGCCLLVRRYMGHANLEAFKAWRVDRSLPYDGVWNTHRINVYRVDPAAGTVAEISDLGGQHALFLGCNGSFGLAVADCPPGILPNHIYYTDNEEQYAFYTPKCARDIGIYNMEDGSFHQVQPPSPWLDWPLPAWIIPSFGCTTGQLS